MQNGLHKVSKFLDKKNKCKIVNIIDIIYYINFIIVYYYTTNMNKIIDESYTTLEDVLGYYYDCPNDFTDVALFNHAV
jgi:hypothetical protein